MWVWNLTTVWCWGLHSESVIHFLNKPESHVVQFWYDKGEHVFLQIGVDTSRINQCSSQILEFRVEIYEEWLYSA